MSIVSNKVYGNYKAKTLTFTAMSASSAVQYFDYDVKDFSTVILVKNANVAEKTITIATGDMFKTSMSKTISIPASSTVALTIESANHKYLTGANKGTIGLSANSTDISACIVSATIDLDANPSS